MEEQSKFIQILGDYPLIRVIDFLIYSRDFDYPITEIAKNANVHFQTFKKLWPGLELSKIIVLTRVLGGANLYKINVKNPIVQKLIEFDNFISWQYANGAEEIAAQ